MTSLKKVSVEDYAKLIGVSAKTVYRRIDRGQIETCKDVVNNKEVTRIMVDEEDIVDGKLANQSNSTGMTEPFSMINTTNGTDENNFGVSEKYLDLLRQLYEDNQYLSELAGQAKLLSDSENKTKQEYFQLVQENRTLLEQKIKLETKNEVLEEQLEASKGEMQQRLEELQKSLMAYEKDQNTQSWFVKLLTKKIF